MPKKGTGWHPHWDPQSDDFLIEDQTDVLPKRALAMALSATAMERALTAARTRRMFRQWLFWYQNGIGSCTAHGTFTCMSADPVRQAKRGQLLGDPLVFYNEIRAIDQREHGLNFDEGATSLAAMKASLRRGYCSRYLWTHDTDVAVQTVLNIAPVMCGTWWYPSMFRRDAEGIIRIRDAAGSPDSGHWYTVNGIDLKRGLVRIANTWGDGYYWLPIEDWRRLHREDGEFALFDELVVPVTKKVSFPIAGTSTAASKFELAH
jgi:hypothetical protein